MKLRNKRGFTLIELLVVVLIIGLLAAVALPQYNRAVKKAQGREVLLAIDAINKGVRSYYLTNSTYEGLAYKPDILDVQIPTLKYFKYVNPGVSGGSSYEFKGFFKPGAPESLSLDIWHPTNPRFTISVDWKENGRAHCPDSGQDRIACQEFFDCHMKDVQVGTDDTTTSRCYIN